MSIPRIVTVGLGLIVGTLGAMAWVQSCKENGGNHAEQQTHVYVGAANVHVGTAQTLPDHSQALATAQADSDRAWAEVRRLRKIVAPRPSPVPNPAVPPQAGGDATVDLCAEQLAADRELIEAQDRQIQGLKMALSDEQRRSSEWKAAFENERKARQAQEVATKAWKSAVTTGKWRGRVEGFAAGAALGYLGGRR